MKILPGLSSLPMTTIHIFSCTEMQRVQISCTKYLCVDGSIVSRRLKGSIFS